MADQDIVAAARALKIAHVRATVLGGEHQTAVSTAFSKLMDAVGEVDEPDEVTAYRAEVQQNQPPTTTGTVHEVEVNASQEQSASSGGGQP
jgi:hypothetical protein